MDRHSNPGYSKQDFIEDMELILSGVKPIKDAQILSRCACCGSSEVIGFAFFGQDVIAPLCGKHKDATPKESMSQEEVHNRQITTPQIEHDRLYVAEMALSVFITAEYRKQLGDESMARLPLHLDRYQWALRSPSDIWKVWHHCVYYIKDGQKCFVPVPLYADDRFVLPIRVARDAKAIYESMLRGKTRAAILPGGSVIMDSDDRQLQRDLDRNDRYKA